MVVRTAGGPGSLIAAIRSGTVGGSGPAELAAVALLASWLRAYRAAHMGPMLALRSD